MENIRSSVFVAMLQVDCDPWREIAFTGQEPTWLSQLDPRVSAIHVISRSPSRMTRYFDQYIERARVIRLVNPVVRWTYKRIGSRFNDIVPDYEIGTWATSTHPALRASSADMIFLLPRKELALFHYFLYERTEPYLFLTNTSSYVNTPKLANLVDSLPRNKYYGGRIENFLDITFVSGSCRLLSRDVVDLALKNRALWNYGLIDDVALGLMLSELGISPSSFSSLTFKDLLEISNAKSTDIQEAIHIRLKSGTPRQRQDELLMKEVHSRVVNSLS